MLDNKILIKIFFIFILLSSCFLAVGADDEDFYASPKTGIYFIENKGQWHEDVLFKAQLADHLSVFFEADGWTISILDPEDIKHSHAHHNDHEHHHDCQIHGHALKVKLLDNESAMVSGQGQKPLISNFFTGNTHSNSSGVRSFSEILYENAWPGIDLRFYTSEGQRLKYEFIINENADYKQIQLQYKGQDDLKIEHGHLIIGTSLDEISELSPVAWKTKDGQQDYIQCEFRLDQNILSFAPKGIKKGEAFIIDPELIFSTYTGSLSDNWGFSATDDLEGNVYSGGIVSGPGYPVSPGAFQQDFGGNWDIAIIKYNPTGTERLYATYLGGTYADLPHSLVVNQNNELLIFGTTGSPDFPTTNNAWDNSFNGGTSIYYDGVLSFPQGVDLFVACLSSDGSMLVHSTFIGGSENDGLNYRSRYAPYLMHGNDSLYYNYGDGARGEIITDDQNNVYIGSCTFSDDFPVTANAFQTSNNGLQEGVAFRLDPALSQLVWSSYIGGSLDDAVYSVDIDSEGRLYASGGTVSQDFPMTSNAWQSSFQGGSTDAFVCAFSADGSSLSGSTYYGSDAYDQAYFVRCSRDDDVFIYGQTAAQASQLIINNPPYAQQNSGQFIAKFPSSMDQISWSTVFGTGSGTPNISPTAFGIDMCNRIYVSGWGRIWGNYTINGHHYAWGDDFGTVGMEITPDAAQSTTDGQDFYIAVFEEDMNGISYGTYFGELHYSSCYYSGHDHVDGGTSRFDKRGYIYQSVCASCGNCQQFPTWPNPGAWSNTNNGGNCNNAVFKIHVQSDFALADFKQPAPGCSAYIVEFENLGQGSSFEWNFGDPSSGSANTSTEENPVHTYNQPGIFSVQLIAHMLNGCYPTDTIIRNVLVMSDTSYYLPDTAICSGSPIQIGIEPVPDTGIHYHWNPTNGLSDSTIANPIASPGQSTLYTLIVSNGFCADTIRQWVYVSEQYAWGGPDTVICHESWELIAQALPPPDYFLWSSNPAFSDTLNNYPDDSTALVSVVNSQSFYLKVGSPEGCVVFDTVTITSSQAASDLASDTSICRGDSIHLQVNITSTSGIESIIWQPDSLIISGQGTENILIKAPLDFVLHLHMTDSIGCSFTDSMAVHTFYPSGKLELKNVSCYGQCDGTIELFPYGGLAPYQFQWSNGDTTAIADSLCAGTHSVIINDAAGCSQSHSYEINEPLPYFIISSISAPGCFGKPDGKIQVDVSGATPPYTYLWSNGASGHVIDNLLPGIYELTISDSLNCDTTLSFEVEQAGLFLITDSLHPPRCAYSNDGFITVNVSGSRPPYRYFWDGVEGMDSIGGLNGGTYELHIVDEGNCDTTLFFELEAPEAYQIEAQIQDVACYGDSSGSIQLELSGGTAPYEIEWQHGESGSYTGNLPAGMYQAVLSDANDCDTVLWFEILQADSIWLEADITNVSCFGLNDAAISVRTHGGTQPYSYLWGGGETDSVLNNIPAGTYSLLLRDQNECTIEENWFIQQPEKFNIQSVIKNPSCNGSNDGSINIEASGGTPPYQYLWSNGESSAEINNLLAGSYELQLSDANNCDTSLLFVLTDPEIINLTAEIEEVHCFGGSDGRIEIHAQGGTKPYTFLWTNGSTDSIASGLTAGFHELLLKDAHDCDTIFEFEIHQPQTPITLETEITDCICFGDESGSITTTVSGGSPPYTFEWSNGETGSNISNLSAGSYSLSIRDAQDCDTAFFFEIGQPEEIIINASISDASCYSGTKDGSIETQISGGHPPYHFLWSTGSESQDIRDLPPGNYQLSITDSAHCVQAADFYVGSPDSIRFNADIVSVRCYGDEDGAIYLNPIGGTEPYSIIWDDGSTGTELLLCKAGMYSAELTDKNGCNALESFLVSQPNKLLLDFDIEPVICIGRSNGKIESHVDGGIEPYSYLWNNGSIEADLFDIPTGTYNLIVSDNNSCQIEKEIYLPEEGCPLTIPNVITPNGDGYNDYFKIINIQYYPGNKLLIFNRWGKEIASFSNYQNDWDGKKNDGSRASDGTYYFILQIPGEEQIQGVISILH